MTKKETKQQIEDLKEQILKLENEGAMELQSIETKERRFRISFNETTERDVLAKLKEFNCEFENIQVRIGRSRDYDYDNFDIICNLGGIILTVKRTDFDLSIPSMSRSLNECSASFNINTLRLATKLCDGDTLGLIGFLKERLEHAISEIDDLTKLRYKIQAEYENKINSIEEQIKELKPKKD